MASLFLMWNIQPGKEEEYRRFIFKDYLPALGELGLTPGNALYRLAGHGPDVLSVVSADSPGALEVTLRSQGWRELADRLQQFVCGFQLRRVISPPRVRL